MTIINYCIIIIINAYYAYIINAQYNYEVFLKQCHKQQNVAVTAATASCYKSRQ